MVKIIIQDKEIATPGEKLAEGMDVLPGAGTYRQGENIVANKLGLVSISGRGIKIIPLSGRYSPKIDDVIICKVFDVGFSGWRLETNTAYSAMLSLKDGTTDFVQRGADLTQYYNLGDYVVCKITNVTSQKLIDLTIKGPGLRKLGAGRIIEVDSNKVPRIIGKQGSMVSMIKQTTGTNIVVGQNGLVWISGEPKNELKAIEAIRMIEQKSHISGLTDKIKAFLEGKEVK
tara:strand:- start:19927 stop:20616 length:690 start_codon:yes stop_codon:yes gene_type:complete